MKNTISTTNTTENNGLSGKVTYLTRVCAQSDGKLCDSVLSFPELFEP